MDEHNADPKAQEMNEDDTELVAAALTSIGSEEVPTPTKEHSAKKPVSTLKEENDKLRTYLGLVKFCNSTAINKIKCAISETMDAIHSSNETPLDANVVLKQLEVIQNEIINMQSIHSQLDEGVEVFHEGENQTFRAAVEESPEQTRETVVVYSRHEVPRKSTGIKRTVVPNKTPIKSKNKGSKETPIETNLLNRINPKKALFSSYEDNSQLKEVSSEENEAVANIDMTSAEDRENLANETQETVQSEPYVIRAKVTKRPYISEEFKTSHLQRLEEAKRRREEMNRQLEREGKRRPKIKRGEESARDMVDIGKKSPKKRPIKKKVVGKVMKKKVQSPIVTQSIVVPLNQSTLDSLATPGQTIQIIAGGGTQILCRNDGTFTAIPPSNSGQWTTSGAQWAATTTDVNITPSQWNQYQQ